MRIQPLAAALVLLAGPAWAAPWKQIRNEDGIRVWQREVAGSDRVEFRGKGRVNADFLRTTAVIRNVDRLCEWRANCVASRVLQLHTPTKATSYYRVDSPVPFVQDRDTVFDAWLEVDAANKRIVARFRQTKHDKDPAPEGVVRMPVLTGQWLIEPRPDGTSNVVYELVADVGGSIPRWIANWASRRLPFKAIAGLRKQVRRTDYEADVRALEAALDLRSLKTP